MRSLFASRRQSQCAPSSTKSMTTSELEMPTDDDSSQLPLPPARPDQQETSKKSGLELTNMEEFAAKLEATCRSLLQRFEGVTTWSVSVCTTDGKRVAVGDRNAASDNSNFFPMNELCYLLNFCLAYETLGEAKLDHYFASRPIPRDRDEFSLHPDGRAWNPLCRSGGLLMTSLLLSDLEESDRLAKIHEYYRKISVDCSICCDNMSYNLKRLYSHGEIGLAHYLAFYERYPKHSDLEKTLDLYFKLCSTAIMPESAAIVAAVFANGGQCPFTDSKLIPEKVVKKSLTQILHACSADKNTQAECEKYGIWLANRSGAGLLIIPGMLGLSFSLEGANNQQSAKCLRLVVQKVRQLIKVDDSKKGGQT